MANVSCTTLRPVPAGTSPTATASSKHSARYARSGKQPRAMNVASVSDSTRSQRSSERAPGCEAGPLYLGMDFGTSGSRAVVIEGSIGPCQSLNASMEVNCLPCYAQTIAVSDYLIIYCLLAVESVSWSSLKIISNDCLSNSNMVPIDPTYPSFASCSLPTQDQMRQFLQATIWHTGKPPLCVGKVFWRFSK